MVNSRIGANVVMVNLPSTSESVYTPPALEIVAKGKGKVVLASFTMPLS